MKQVELVVQALDFASLDELKMADALIIGEKEYGLRLPYYYSHDELIKAIQKIKNNGQRVYLALNNIFHEYDLNKLDQYRDEMKDYPIDGLIFGDLAVYQIAEKYNLVDRLIYNPETYMTNYMSVHFFKEKGIKRVVLAKEITLEDTKMIGQEVDMELEVLVHGAVNMFHSKRNLVTNYFRYIEKDQPDQLKDEPLYIVEEKRKNLKYPIIEDHNGTHIYREHDMCAIEYLDELVNNGITSLRIDSVFKSIEQLTAVISIYRQAINDLIEGRYEEHKSSYIEQLETIPGLRSFDTGFLFKKTVYKG